MTDMALYELYQHYGGGGYTQYYFECYNLFGDPSTVLLHEGPQIIIQNIQGGLSVSATVKNIGTEAATDLDWSITITGGLLGLVNSETTGTITELPVGDEEPIQSNLCIGLGRLTITITAGEKQQEITGFILGPYILI